MSSETPPFDPPLTKAEQARVNRLSATEVEKIDTALLANVVSNWRKLARVVAETMNSLKDEVPLVPDLFYAHRVMFLVGKGLVESQGNLRRMRYSEVRLPQREGELQPQPSLATDAAEAER